MNLMKPYLSISHEVEHAVANGKPVLALESTILSHGMPYPQNMEFAKKAEAIAREEGAIPATTAIIDGMLKIGLNEQELERMCKAEHVQKVSRRDLPIIVSTKGTGATTVASTMILATLAGIKIFSTGGLGGVHRGAETSFDISADLQELANTPIAVVSSGVKSLLDIGHTLEYLETMGVPVIGLKTESFPAFYSRESGFNVDYSASTHEEAARIAKTKWNLGLKGGLVIANPVPEEYALDFNEMDTVIHKALSSAEKDGIHGKDITPYLLAHVVEFTGGKSLQTNLALAYSNVREGAKIAVAFSNL
jgi:Uncharacterized enzyme involved in pigment biosynthesis